MSSHSETCTYAYLVVCILVSSTVMTQSREAFVTVSSATSKLRGVFASGKLPRFDESERKQIIKINFWVTISNVS